MAFDEKEQAPEGRRKERRERIPFGQHRRRTHVDEEYKDKNFVYRWVNDVDDRLRQAEDAGYRFVTREEVPRVGDQDVDNDNTDLSDKVSRIVTRNAHPQIRAFLMKIKKEWFEEDQALKEERNRRVDEAIRKTGSADGRKLESGYGLGVKYRP